MVAMIDQVIMNIEDKVLIGDVRKRVNEMMSDYPMFVA
jgi:glycine/serine hydroxymethyltransferase